MYAVERPHLAGDGVDDLGSAVPDVHVPEAGHAVDVLVAVVVVDQRALAAHDRDEVVPGRAGVGVQEAVDGHGAIRPGVVRGSPGPAAPRRTRRAWARRGRRPPRPRPSCGRGRPARLRRTASSTSAAVAAAAPGAPRHHQHVLAPRRVARPRRWRSPSVPRHTSSCSLVSSRASGDRPVVAAGRGEVGQGAGQSGAAPRRARSCGARAASSARRSARSRPVRGRKPSTTKRSVGQAADDQRRQRRRGPRHRLDHVARRRRRPPPAARRGRTRRACRRRSPPRRWRRRRGAGRPRRRAGLGVLVGHDQPRAGDAGVLQEPAGAAGVLADDGVGAGEGLDGTGRAGRRGCRSGWRPGPAAAGARRSGAARLSAGHVADSRRRPRGGPTGRRRRPRPPPP